MHQFTELADRCASFTLEALNAANERTLDALQTSAATSLVKTLQMILLQKTILSVGMFSIFEANLQDQLNCKNGFDGAKEILDKAGETDLKERFIDLCMAINVLKHGHGPSYKKLVAKAEALPFRIKLPDESFFDEGDIAETIALVEVDDTFVRQCSIAISQVSEVIRQNQ